MRLYRGEVLRIMQFWPACNGDAAEFSYRLMFSDKGDKKPRVRTYTAATIEGIFDQLRADGHQVWGKDTLDYACPPTNALEYLLMEAQLKREEYSDAEIQALFSLDEVKHEDSPE